jgi:hypothetical protein
MTPADRQIYNQLCKLQGSLWKLIGQIESIKINLAGCGV